MSDLATDTPSTSETRGQLVDRLLAQGRIGTPQIERALRTVPRHLFTTDPTDLGAAYADDVVITKRAADGTALSSVSAPWLQAAMLHAAQLRPGARVLEIGSGGYNAALIAELVGPAGQVTTIDIDPEIVGNARTRLDTAGYPQVNTAVADGEDGWPAGAPYDAVIVTVNAGDVPPAWTGQLAPGGVLVVPLRFRAMTRCLTLHRHDNHLEAAAALQCGFVAMQGTGSSPTRRVALRGDDIVLSVDDTTTEVDRDALIAALAGPRVEQWAPVTISLNDGPAYESLHLWLASTSRPFGVLTVDRETTRGLVDPQDRFVCPTLFTAGSFAYLTQEQTDNSRWRFGAHGFGPNAKELTAALIEDVIAWDHDHRHHTGPIITVHPAGSQPPPSTGRQALVHRRHTTIAVTWPGEPDNR